MARARRTRLLAVAVGALTAMCAGILASTQPASAATYVPISGAGSNLAYSAIRTWITNVAQFGLPVNYANVDSAAGRSQFALGTVDFAASDIPYGVQDGTNNDPPPTRGHAYIPELASATTFTYNLSTSTQPGGQQVTGLRLSGAAIAAIFTGTITMWNDPVIEADNPGVALPTIKIIPVVPTTESWMTAYFTQWMLATEPSYWNAYCQKVGRTPCTQTSSYPVLPGSAMIGQPGGLGVSSYVSQTDGAIGFGGYSNALEAGLPVVKVLNAAGYYTEPSAGNIAVSLLKARTDPNPSDPLYGTEDLSGVYTDTDPRTYELSSYSYLIVPTDTSFGFSTDRGYTLGAFGQYLLCQGQSSLRPLGYTPLPTDLVKAGFAQLQKIPGNNVPAPTTEILQSCNNPTYSPNGGNPLADSDPNPPACDMQGQPVCNLACGTSCTTVPVGSVGLISLAALAGCVLFVIQRRRWNRRTGAGQPRTG